MVGLSQLMLDIYDLRMSLIAISKLKQDSKSQTSYSSFVNKTLSRSETILKLIQMSLDKFVENFGQYAKKLTSLHLHIGTPLKLSNKILTRYSPSRVSNAQTYQAC